MTILEQDHLFYNLLFKISCLKYCSLIKTLYLYMTPHIIKSQIYLFIIRFLYVENNSDC